jgi:hypothetical protein
MWVYLLGIAVRTILTHGLLTNPNVRGDLDWQVVNCLFWPISTPLLILKTRLKR